MFPVIKKNLLGIPKILNILKTKIFYIEVFQHTSYVIKNYKDGIKMLREDIIKKSVEHKHLLIFAAGVATAIVGKKILESQTVKDAATKGMASVMSAKKDAEECFQDMKENAEDIVVDANSDVKKEVYIESKE